MDVIINRAKENAQRKLLIARMEGDDRNAHILSNIKDELSGEIEARRLEEINKTIRQIHDQQQRGGGGGGFKRRRTRRLKKKAKKAKKSKKVKRKRKRRGKRSKGRKKH